jgi:uncharacterized protein
VIDPIGSSGSGDRVIEMLLDLFQRLRRAGVPVSLAEKVDATHALAVLSLGDRSVLRSALRSTLVKDIERHHLYDRCFDAAFPLTGGQQAPPAESAVLADGADEPGDAAEAGADDGADGPGGGKLEAGAPPSAGFGSQSQTADADMLAELVAALQGGDRAALDHLAGRYVAAYAGLSAQPGSERSHYYRVLRAADLANLLASVMRQQRTDQPEVMDDPFLAKLELTELSKQVDHFRQLIAEHIRGHLDDLRAANGQEPMRADLADLDLLDASVTDLRALREVVRPLARKLASRLAQRRRFHRRGRLDMRRTLRHSLAYGGVPVEVRMRARRASKPEIVMLCDVSGSVAEFAHFTLTLMQGMHEEMARLRTFVFVDGVADVTETLAAADADFDPRFLIHQPGAVIADGHSDYGAVLAAFARSHADVVTPSTTVIVTGDARTNFRAAGFEEFAALAGRARRVYWFNPEPRDDWDTKDSEISRFATWCTAVFEVRTLTDLIHAVSHVIDGARI